MACALPKVPKQWCLGKIETITSFESWRQNLLYTLNLDSHFAPFLVESMTWCKKTKTNPNRGFVDDPVSVPVESRKTAQQKAVMLDLMLGQIANFCPVIARNCIVRNSTSLNDIWSTIRLHYGFQATGAHFLDFSDIKYEADERPEDLYQRILAFVEDNLLTSGGGITHHGEPIQEDEELTPTIENFIVLHWLKLLHPDLPQVVKQRYGTELRSRTLASLKPEISQALTSLLESVECSRAMRAAALPPRSRNQPTPWRTQTQSRAQTQPRAQTPSRARSRPKPTKSCPLCLQAGRPSSHFLSACPYLPESDKQYMAKARQVAKIFDNDETLADDVDSQDSQSDPGSQYASECGESSTLRVQVRQSPYFDTFYNHHAVRITLDSGATGNMMRASTAHALGCSVNPTSQSAHQADGSSPLEVVGETRLTFSRDQHVFHFEGLIVENLDVEVLAGTPFMERNDVAIRPAKRQIMLDDGTVYSYGSVGKSKGAGHAVRRAHVLRAPSQTMTLWPGDFLELALPPQFADDESLALEPRTDSPPTPFLTEFFPVPQVVPSIAGRIRIPNLSETPCIIRRNSHLCQVSPMVAENAEQADLRIVDQYVAPSTPSHGQKPSGLSSASVTVDPDNILPSQSRRDFQTLHAKHDDVFSSSFKGYNGASGPFQAVVNMGPVQPPQRKGRLPLYSHDKLVELQAKFDDLEDLGIFARPEDIGVTVEYVNPSFLVKKPNGGHRLVTAFADVGRYSKPQPSVLPDVDSTLRKIGQWKYLVATDLASAFYQIPLSQGSMKYCGVATPFRGIRVYTRCAMGMPGSETALEELMCRVLGDLLVEGIVVKLADDLYCGADTPQALLQNWSRVLQALASNGLHLSPSKTTVCPKTTTVLGWIWSEGTLRASPHRMSTLSTCSPPTTVKGMRSFIGAYKMLARVIPNCATYLSPLDTSIAGLKSQDRIHWTDELHDSFAMAQSAIQSSRTITLPRPSDQLWIVTDGSVKKHGLGATMYVTRDQKPLVAGFFSAKLHGRQVTWLPCEVEALSIATATKHFSPYIIQSHHPVCILTDSKPCVQAYEKLCRGEFSASPRVSTFLTTVSRYQVSIRHLAGSANVPADFASRNAPPCHESKCQVCSFISQLEGSAVHLTAVEEVLSGHARIPFTSRNAWGRIQSECPDLRRTHAHLKQGTRPSKKLTDIRDVKRYLQVATIASDGLLVVRQERAFQPRQERIIVPRRVLAGILTALHLQLSHPTPHQLRQVVSRYFYALDLDAAIQQVTLGCHSCLSLRNVPQAATAQSTSDPPCVVGVSFAADVIKRARQLIFVIRETVTAYTSSILIPDERADTLRDALLQLCLPLRPLEGPLAVVRTDPAPGFVALRNDDLLRRQGVELELGHAKNVNKNPVAEKAIRELEDELLRDDPHGGPITPLALALATNRLNSRLRGTGLSARELWTQRDQFTSEQIPITDKDVITKQHNKRLSNHGPSVKSKAPSRPPPSPDLDIQIGDLVYLRTERSKTHSRSRYLVCNIEGEWCNIRKFVGSQLRSSSYRVRRSDCLKVPSDCSPLPGWQSRPSESTSDDADDLSFTTVTTGARPPPHPPDLSAEKDVLQPPHGSPDSTSLPSDPRPPDPPDIPCELSTPQDEPLPSDFTTTPCVPLASRRYPERNHRAPSYLSDYVLK